MPADPIHPDQLGGAAVSRRPGRPPDSLPLDQLADLLSELPNRQQPLGLGVLMVALNERLPDAYKLLQRRAARPGEGRRRSLRELIADRQEPGATPTERDRDRQGQERDREPEDDFSDSWRAYRERAEHIRQNYRWTVPQPPPRAEPWLPLGRYDDQEHDQPPDRSWRWLGEERDRKDR
jgi:hypothetical protein